MQECNTTAHWLCKDGGPACSMHQRRTEFCHPFFSTEGVKPIEIHRRMKVQYGYACLSLQQVHEWTRNFMKSFRPDEEVQ
jgi:hypothetical protein